MQAVLGAINVNGVLSEAFAGQLFGSVVAAVVVVVVVPLRVPPPSLATPPSPRR